MALTVPELTPTIQCSVAVSILDADVNVVIRLTPQQAQDMTDEELDSKLGDLIQALSELCPGMEVQYVKQWTSNANTGAWESVPTA